MLGAVSRFARRINYSLFIQKTESMTALLKEPFRL